MRLKKPGDQYLKTLGFIYLAGSYIRLDAADNLLRTVEVQKLENRFTVELAISYPFGDNFAVVSPREASSMRSDGSLGRPPTFAEIDHAIELDALETLLRSSLLDQLAMLASPAPMMQLWAFLMGRGECPPQFGAVAADPFTERRETPQALRGFAAYAIAAKEFDLAAQALASPLLAGSRHAPFESKLLADIAAKNVTITDGSKAILRSGQYP